MKYYTRIRHQYIRLWTDLTVGSLRFEESLKDEVRISMPASEGIQGFFKSIRRPGFVLQDAFVKNGGVGIASLVNLRVEHEYLHPLCHY